MKQINSTDQKKSEKPFLTLVDLLSYRSQTQTDSLAYLFLKDGESESDELTYGQLYKQAQQIAVHLQSLKFNYPRALLLYNSGLEFISAFFGCLCAGVIAIPVYFSTRRRKIDIIQNILCDAQTKLILTTESLLVDLQKLFEQMEELTNVEWVTTDNLENSLSSAWQKPSISGDSLAFYQYTSGSTNMPKGVMVSHANILHNEKIIQQAFNQDEKTIVLGWLPHYHDMGLIGNILQPFYIGRPCILMSPLHFLQQPFRWLKAISRYRATCSGGPNFAYDLCVQKITPAEREELDLSSWKVAFTGAEIIRAETLINFEKMFAPCGFNPSAFYPCYGMAETTLFVTGKKKNQSVIVKQITEEGLQQNQVITSDLRLKRTRTLVGCGITWLEEKILIVDPTSLLPCSPDCIGEIWVKGASVAQGYWNRIEQTQETFSAYLADNSDGPFLRTGDLGFFDDENLFITGRLKDILIIRGQNYYPNDLELTVERSIVGLSPNSGAAFDIEFRGKEQLVVIQEIERAFLKKLDFNEVVNKIRKEIMAEHGLKVYAVSLIKSGTIPKTSSGKIKRHVCKQAFLDYSLSVVYSWVDNLVAPV